MDTAFNKHDYQNKGTKNEFIFCKVEIKPEVIYFITKLEYKQSIFSNFIKFHEALIILFF